MSEPLDEDLKYPVYHVKRFTEKPESRRRHNPWCCAPGNTLEQRDVHLDGGPMPILDEIGATDARV